VGRRGSDRPNHSRTIHRPLDLFSLADLVPIHPSITSIPSIHPSSPTPFLVSGLAFLLFFLFLSLSLSLSLYPLSLLFPLFTLCRPILPSHASWSSSYPVLLSPSRVGSIHSLSIHPPFPFPPSSRKLSRLRVLLLPVRFSSPFLLLLLLLFLPCVLLSVSPFIKWLLFCSIGFALDTVQDDMRKTDEKKTAMI
jgi:hypothetical protein